MPCPYRRHGAVETAPGHDCGVLRDATLKDLIPTNDPAPLRVHMLLDALDEVALQRLFVGDVQLAHTRLDSWRCLPLILDALVTADMNVFAREKRHHLVEHVIEERERAVVYVVEVWIEAPIGGHRTRWMVRHP